MKYWLVLWRSKGAGSGERVAQTADLGLVGTLINGLHTNFLIEDDEQDRIFDPEFIRTAPAVATQLTREIRQAAVCGWAEEENEENEEAAAVGQAEEKAGLASSDGLSQTIGYC